MTESRIKVEYTNNADIVSDKIQAALVTGLNKAAEHLLAESKKQVPLDIGSLSGSGHVTPAHTDMSEPASSVSYDTPYAARLHEHPEYRFQNGRKGKYLEDPANEQSAEMTKIIAAEIRRAQ